MSATTQMPFGKYKGVAVESLPDAYLTWLAALPDLRDPLRHIVELECERRFGRQQQEDETDARHSTDLDRAIIEKVIDRGVRSLAQEIHPDHGGNHDQMVALNLAAEWLRLQTRRLSA